MDDKDLVLIGKLGKSRGLDGALWVTPYTDYPDRFADLEEVLLSDRGGWEKWVVEGGDVISGRPVIWLKGIGSPEEASRLTNRELAVTRDQLVELPEGSYFLFDLVGCEAVDADSGETIGTVTRVDQYPANDVYTIKTADGRELTAPAVAQWVKSVDIEAKRIEVVTAGLLDGKTK